MNVFDVEYCRMQALFLDEQFCQDFFFKVVGDHRYKNYYYRSYQETLANYKTIESIANDYNFSKIEEKVNKLGIPEGISFEKRRNGICIYSGDQYDDPEYLLSLYQNDFIPHFEADCSVFISIDGYVDIQTEHPFIEKIFTENLSIDTETLSSGFAIIIDIIPVIGDDYPDILKSFKKKRRKQSDKDLESRINEYVPPKDRVIFIKSYTGKGASKESFEQMFKIERLHVIFESELKEYDLSN